MSKNHLKSPPALSFSGAMSATLMSNLLTLPQFKKAKRYGRNNH